MEAREMERGVKGDLGGGRVCVMKSVETDEPGARRCAAPGRRVRN